MVADTDGAGTLIAASCVLVGRMGVLIRGPSGSGKSTLARALMRDPAPFLFARLVGDDAIYVRAVRERLLASTPATIAGRVEQRGLGLLTLPYEPLARVGLIVDLVAPENLERLPHSASLQADIAGVTLSRLAVPERNGTAPRLVLDAMAALMGGRELADFAT